MGGGTELTSSVGMLTVLTVLTVVLAVELAVVLAEVLAEVLAVVLTVVLTVLMALMALMVLMVLTALLAGVLAGSLARGLSLVVVLASTLPFKPETVFIGDKVEVMVVTVAALASITAVVVLGSAFRPRMMHGRNS